MYDLSKERDKEFLKEANRWLQLELVSANKKIFDLMKQNALDEEICRKLADELHVLRQRFFANKQEKIEADKKPKEKKKKKRKIVHNEKLVPPQKDSISLEEEKVVHQSIDLKCPCGEEKCDLRVMVDCFEESSEITVVERKYTVKRHQRQKYTGTMCGRITTAPGPTKLVPGGEFSIQMGVEVACDKFERHLPLERQRKEMDGQGLIVDTKTLYSLTEHVAAHLNEVPKMIKAEILGQKWAHLDESPMPFFNPSKSRGYVWTLSNNFGTFYQFEPTRSGLVAKEMLGHYKGAVMTDAFGGYNFLDEWEGITHALCWAHLRRKFFESMNNYPKAKMVVAAIDRLFEVEHKAVNFEELKILRLKESFPIVDLIEEMIKELKGNCLESSSLGKAIKYYEKGRKNFRKFLFDPYVPISNNRAELSQRDAVMGRKNYQYFRSINGADTAMLFYTIIGTCKTHDVRARTYLLEMTLRAARGETLETPYQYALNRQKWAEEQVLNGLNSIPQGP